MRILELPTILEMLCYYAGQLRCDIFFRGTFDQSFIISYRSIEPIYKWLIEDTNCAHKKWSNSNLFENTFLLKIFVCLTFPWSINQKLWLYLYQIVLKNILGTFSWWKIIFLRNQNRQYINHVMDHLNYRIINFESVS